MLGYEFRALPAPEAVKSGRKGAEGSTVEQVISSMGRMGWEYLRTDLVPSEEKGLFGMRRRPKPFLVFRRVAPTSDPIPFRAREAAASAAAQAAAPAAFTVQPTAAEAVQARGAVQPRRVKTDLVQRIRSEKRRPLVLTPVERTA